MSDREECSMCGHCTKIEKIGCPFDVRKTFSTMEYDYIQKKVKDILNNIRRAKNMTELEQNSFVKMFTEGWCSDCSFDSAKCAEQHECEAFKTVNKALNSKGGDNNEETV